LKEKILRFFKRHPGQMYPRRDLIRHLKISDWEKKDFRDELKRLIEAGQIIKARKGGYIWTGNQAHFEGKLVLTRKGFGFVLQDDGEDIFVHTRNLIGAIHNDFVKVQLLPGGMIGSNREGRIIKIIERGSDYFIGTVIKQNGAYFLDIEPVTPKRGILISRKSNIRLKENNVVKASVIKWNKGKNPIEVKITEKIGSMNNPLDDMKVVCFKYDLLSEFPGKVKTEASSFSQKDIKNELKNRQDLRDTFCITIDPESAKDFDDAVSLEVNSRGQTILGVHIADVSHFVRSGSEIDREAARRGTTVYFAEGAVHMLPENLSSDLCSLTPGQDSLALSVLITLNKKYGIEDVSFHKSAIKNHKRLTYRKAQNYIDNNDKSKIGKILNELDKIAKHLFNQREKWGSIDFDIPEPIFTFKNGMPHEIHPSERLESHRIVEEMMLLANRLVAEKIPVKNDESLPFIYRIHDKPSLEKVEKFLTFLRKIGIYKGHSEKLTSSVFRDILASVEDSPYNTLIETLVLRTMAKACYSIENRGHFGLAFWNYTHFTSPIRRYPDLIVHRLIKKYIFNQKFTISEEKLSSIASVSTQAEILAVNAERDYIKMKQIRWLTQRIGQTFDGIISGVVSAGLFVELKDSMVEGFISIEKLPREDFIFDDTDFSLLGRKSQRKFRLGDEVKIVVLDVILEKKSANFVLA